MPTQNTWTNHNETPAVISRARPPHGNRRKPDYSLLTSIASSRSSTMTSAWRRNRPGYSIVSTPNIRCLPGLLRRAGRGQRNCWPRLKPVSCYPICQVSGVPSAPARAAEIQSASSRFVVKSRALKSLKFFANRPYSQPAMTMGYIWLANQFLARGNLAAPHLSIGL